MNIKETIVSFLSNLVSVVLGIVITFAVQGRINKLQDRREVDSALRLVRTELAANRADITEMRTFLEDERRSAAYFLENRKALYKCPADSVLYHSGVLFADVSISLSSDALELLKMSSLFQKIGNNDLSMKIIRAYDCCATMVSALNGHIEERDNRFQTLMEDRFSNRKARDGVIRVADLLQSDYGLYSIRLLAGSAGTEIVADMNEVDEAIAALDAYLLPTRKHK